MPNHVQNQITAPAEVIEAITRPGDDGSPAVDFALIIPEPLNIEIGGCSGRHEPGVICWYEWNISNWGTKWNGYQTEIAAHEDGIVQLRFQTAWSHPLPVIGALSKKFPEAYIEVSYADEDLGANLGKYTIRNGEHTYQDAPEEYSDEANDFAAQLHYGKTYDELKAEWGEG